MDKKTVKSVIYNISFILGIDAKSYDDSSFFYSEKVEHHLENEKQRFTDGLRFRRRRL